MGEVVVVCRFEGEGVVRGDPPQSDNGATLDCLSYRSLVKVRFAVWSTSTIIQYSELCGLIRGGYVFGFCLGFFLGLWLSLGYFLDCLGFLVVFVL